MIDLQIIYKIETNLTITMEMIMKNKRRFALLSCFVLLLCCYNVTIRANAQTNYQLTKQSLTMNTGESESLSMNQPKSKHSFSYQILDLSTGENNPTGLTLEADLNSPGTFTVYAKKQGSYQIKASLTITNKKGNQKQFTDYCTVDVALKGFEEEGVAYALGTEQKLVYGGLGKKVTFTSSHPEIATVDKKGIVIAKSVGSTTISTNLKDSDGQPLYQCTVDVTKPSVTFHDKLLLKGNVISYEITGQSVYSKVSVSSSNLNIVSVDQDKLLATGGGTAKISFAIDGKSFTKKLRIYDPRFEEPMYLLSKGENKNIQVTGFPSGSEITYSVENKKIAPLSSDGTITGKKYGNTILTAKSNDITIQCGISVTTPNAAASVKRALSAVGSQYSQALRMEEGYYDCSSFVWRSYQESGIRFGSETWAPTAADIALSLVNQDQTLSEQALSPKDLLAGDLIFYSSSQNGRYLNIDHVAIFTGLMPAPDYWYTDVLYTGAIAEAGSRGVVHDVYQENKPIVLIARPR